MLFLRPTLHERHGTGFINSHFFQIFLHPQWHSVLLNIDFYSFIWNKNITNCFTTEFLLFGPRDYKLPRIFTSTGKRMFY